MTHFSKRRETGCFDVLWHEAGRQHRLMNGQFVDRSAAQVAGHGHRARWRRHRPCRRWLVTCASH